MKVLHLCLCGPFTDGFLYQENELIEQHIALGHEVTVIAGTDTYGKDKKIQFTEPGESTLDCGAKLIRLPYRWGLSGWLGSKIRAYQGLEEVLNIIKPDSMLFHGLCAWDILTTANYVKDNPKVLFYADCHEDFNNSAKTWLSRVVLHKFFYRTLFQFAINEIDEVLCITIESLDFAKNFYGSPENKTSIYPLGGLIETQEKRNERRTAFRNKYAINETDIVITQTGKLDSTKRLIDALKAFHAQTASNLRFVIAGKMSEDVHDECISIIKSDHRILDLGWQNSEELRTVLAGSDCFLQPFGQTVTTQMAMCSGCAVLAQDVPSHRWLIGEKGKLFRDTSELQSVYEWAANNPELIVEYGEASLSFAIENLDYRKLAFKIVPNGR